MVGDVRRDATTVPLGRYDLATCFGDLTVMLGSEELCDIAAPLRPHNSAIDEMRAK